MKLVGIGLGVITNHNKFDKDEYKALAREGKKEGIYILPGVELSVNDGKNGIHTLIIFDPEEWLGSGSDHITSLITSMFVGKANYIGENCRSNYNLIDTVKRLNDISKDYFIIMAHVEQDNGFLQELDGGRIIEFGQNESFRASVLGFQKLKTRDRLKNLENWLDKKVPALVEGSDPGSIEGTRVFAPQLELLFNDPYNNYTVNSTDFIQNQKR